MFSFLNYLFLVWVLFLYFSFYGLSGLLSFCLTGKQPSNCYTNLFIDEDNSIKLIENSLSEYRLFLMIPLFLDIPLQFGGK